MSRPADAVPRGRFIVLDGVDGCGKSTQARLLAQHLARADGVEPLHLREPGGTALGERLRELLLSREHAVPAAVETLLFAAARRQMLEELVAPALAAGRDVVCERFNSSTFAYQAVAGGLEEERVLALLQGWSNEPAPDLVLLIDLPVEEAARRRGAPLDRIEDKGLSFQRAVRAGFLRWAERVPGSALIDGRGTPDEVARRIAERVARTTAEAARG